MINHYPDFITAAVNHDRANICYYPCNIRAKKCSNRFNDRANICM